MKYDQSATKKEGLNPAFCDVDFMIPKVGIAYTVTDAIELNLGAGIAFGLEEEHNAQKFDKLNRLIY